MSDMILGESSALISADKPLALLLLAVVWAACSIWIVVFALNLLIALVCDTHCRVSAASRAVLYKEKVALIEEFERSVPPFVDEQYILVSYRRNTSDNADATISSSGGIPAQIVGLQEQLELLRHEVRTECSGLRQQNEMHRETHQQLREIRSQLAFLISQQSGSRPPTAAGHQR